MALAFLLVILIACTDTAAVVAPRYQLGPGCTIYYRYDLGAGMAEIVVQRFETCPQIVYDTALVNP